MTFGELPFGTTPFGATDLNKLVNEIKVSSEIPPDAKKAVTEYLKNTFREVWETLGELVELQPPPVVAEYWDIVLAIIQNLFG